jgi:hypothetical protein
MEHYTPLGYGSSGVVVCDNALHPSHALKLYNMPADEAGILREGSIQAAATRCLPHILHVPSVHTVTRQPVVFQDADYIAGIYMDPVPGHSEIDGQQVHIALGANLETDEFLPCGFFPTIATLEQLFAFKQSHHSIESVAYTMGRAHRALLDAGIIPDHVKFLYGADDRIWMIGFRHCLTGHIDPMEWLNDRRRDVEPYAPREAQRGRANYIAGFLDFPTN